MLSKASYRKSDIKHEKCNGCMFIMNTKCTKHSTLTTLWWMKTWIQLHFRSRLHWRAQVTLIAESSHNAAAGQWQSGEMNRFWNCGLLANVTIVTQSLLQSLLLVNSTYLIKQVLVHHSLWKREREKERERAVVEELFVSFLWVCPVVSTDVISISRD